MTPAKTPMMLRMVNTLRLKQPTTCAPGLMASPDRDARRIRALLNNGRLFLLPPAGSDEVRASGDCDLDRDRPLFDVLDLQRK